MGDNGVFIWNLKRTNLTRIGRAISHNFLISTYQNPNRMTTRFESFTGNSETRGTPISSEPICHKYNHNHNHNHIHRFTLLPLLSASHSLSLYIFTHPLTQPPLHHTHHTRRTSIEFSPSLSQILRIPSPSLSRFSEISIAGNPGFQVTFRRCSFFFFLFSREG